MKNHTPSPDYLMKCKRLIFRGKFPYLLVFIQSRHLRVELYSKNIPELFVGDSFNDSPVGRQSGNFKIRTGFFRCLVMTAVNGWLKFIARSHSFTEKWMSGGVKRVKTDSHQLFVIHDILPVIPVKIATVDFKRF